MSSTNTQKKAKALNVTHTTGEDAITFAYVGLAKPYVVDASGWTDALRHQYMMHGIRQAYADCFAGVGKSKTLAEAQAQVESRLEANAKGDWSGGRKAGTGEGAIVAEAIAELLGRTAAQIVTMLAGMTDEQRKAITARPDVQLRVLEIKGRRLATAAAGADALDALFGTGAGAGDAE